MVGLWKYLAYLDFHIPKQEGLLTSTMMERHTQDKCEHSLIGRAQGFPALKICGSIPFVRSKLKGGDIIEENIGISINAYFGKWVFWCLLWQ